MRYRIAVAELIRAKATRLLLLHEDQKLDLDDVDARLGALEQVMIRRGAKVETPATQALDTRLSRLEFRLAQLEFRVNRLSSRVD